MAGRKRGPYLQYLNSNNSFKIPRQTLWSQNNERAEHANLYEDVPTLIPEEVEETAQSEIDFHSPDLNDDSRLDNTNDPINFNNIENENGEIFNNTDLDDPTESGEDSDDLADQLEDFEIDDYRTVHENLSCSVNTAMLLIYTFFIRYNLSWSALEDLCMLINEILERKSIPTSRYLFKKKFRTSAQPVTHFLCSSCNKYLGTKEDLQSGNDIYCSVCQNGISTQTKYVKKFFMTIPLEKHLIESLERNIENIDFNRTASPNAEIHDVHDASNFKLLKKKMNDEPYVTLTVNTDGAKVFKSTKHKSLWPIQFHINEICLEKRFKRENVLLAALSFGKTPEMSVLMKPLINEINTINRNGGIKILMQNGERKKVKIFIMLVTADSVAKLYVLEKTGFNGNFGCCYCLHPGTKVEGCKHRKYCNKDNSCIRNNVDTRKSMLEAYLSGEKVDGYHSVSPLTALESNFDIVWQICIDAMHSIDSGVGRKLVNLLLCAKNKKKP